MYFIAVIQYDGVLLLHQCCCSHLRTFPADLYGIKERHIDTMINNTHSQHPGRQHVTGSSRLTRLEAQFGARQLRHTQIPYGTSTYGADLQKSHTDLHLFKDSTRSCMLLRDMSLNIRSLLGLRVQV